MAHGNPVGALNPMAQRSCIARNLSRGTPFNIFALAQSRVRERLSACPARVIGAWHVPLTCLAETVCKRLRASGFFHEIISWSRRRRVPADEGGQEVMVCRVGTSPIVELRSRGDVS